MSQPTKKSSSPSLLSYLEVFFRSVLFDARYFWTVAVLVVLGDALLTQLIIRYVPYTEIDWETYMVHIDLYLKGERNYSRITGPTGPLVYPAGHVHIHRILHEVTDAGRDIPFAQQLYGCIYILSQLLTCAIYDRAEIPNWTLFLLPLSKRLHSIFVLRLFNDCWALLSVQAAVYAFQEGLDDIAILIFSAALSVKMSILLYLPGLLVILFKRHGLAATAQLMVTLLLTQAFSAMAFLRKDYWSYLQNAYDLSRVFLYKWTVNWRFLDEQTFSSPAWARGLLIGHVSTLIAFGLFRWCKADGGVLTVLRRGFRQPTVPAGLSPVTPDYVATVLFTSNLIGIIFARSLHYQFYSWYAQQIPFLVQRTKYPLPLKFAIILGIEYAWNVYPSTRISSAVLSVMNVLLLLGIWFGYHGGKFSS